MTADSVTTFHRATSPPARAPTGSFLCGHNNCQHLDANRKKLPQSDMAIIAVPHHPLATVLDVLIESSMLFTEVNDFAYCCILLI